MVFVYFGWLLSYTKLRKYVVQLILGGNSAGDLAEVVQAAADVEGEEVAGQVVVHALAYVV